jgi:hypothetical protein
MTGNSKWRTDECFEAHMLDLNENQEKLSKELTKSIKEVEIRIDVIQADISNLTQGVTINNLSEVEDQLEAKNRESVNCYIMKSFVHINICPFSIIFSSYFLRLNTYLRRPNLEGDK